MKKIVGIVIILILLGKPLQSDVTGAFLVDKTTGCIVCYCVGANQYDVITRLYKKLEMAKCPGDRYSKRLFSAQAEKLAAPFLLTMTSVYPGENGFWVIRTALVDGYWKIAFGAGDTLESAVDEADNLMIGFYGRGKGFFDPVSYATGKIKRMCDDSFYECLKTDEECDKKIRNE